MERDPARDEQSQVCVECKRSSSAPGDEIVFCSGCRTPYHRLCHNPPIDRIVLEVAEVPWFCHECQGQQQPDEQPLETGKVGAGLDADTKRAYLSSLSTKQLVQLVQYAESLHPNLPIYSPHTAEIVERLQQENADLNALHQKTRPGGNEDLIVDVVRKHTGPLALPELWPAVTRRGIAVDAAFKHSAMRALQRCLRKGKLVEDHGKYVVNPDYRASTDLLLDQLIRGDDNVMFDYMPLRVSVRGGGGGDGEAEKGDMFSHKVYVY